MNNEEDTMKTVTSSGFILGAVLIILSISNSGCRDAVDTIRGVEDVFQQPEIRFVQESEDRTWHAVESLNPVGMAYQHVVAAMQDDATLNNLVMVKGLPDYIRLDADTITHVAYLREGMIYALMRLPDTSRSSTRRIHYSAYRALPQLVKEAFIQATVPETRLALLIGNSTYSGSFSRLTKSRNDVRSMAKALQHLGFTVMLYEDTSQTTLQQAIAEFGNALPAYQVRLFYYSGHGIQSEGENYLVPTKTTLRNRHDVGTFCIPLQPVLERMRAGGNVSNIVILDACHKTSFTWTDQGLAEIEAPDNFLIAYATAPGYATSENVNVPLSIYTNVLLEHLETPDVVIWEMFRRIRNAVWRITDGQQIPWESNSLGSPFYFLREEKPH